VPSLVRSRLEDERFTSLLGCSRSFIEGREGAGETSSLDDDEVGLPRAGRERLEILRSQVWLCVGFCSVPSTDDSLSPEVQGLEIPCLLMELSRESVPVLCVAADGVFILLLRNEVDKRRSIRSDNAGVGVTGSEVGGGNSGEVKERVVALEPGAFLLPGLIRYEFPSDVPSARPAAAMPRVPTAQSWSGS
jgi:hypothetical protein